MNVTRLPVSTKQHASTSLIVMSASAWLVSLVSFSSLLYVLPEPLSCAPASDLPLTLRPFFSSQSATGLEYRGTTCQPNPKAKSRGTKITLKSKAAPEGRLVCV